MEYPSTSPHRLRVPLINAALLIALVLSMIGSYYGWGWALVATGAAVALTRPWAP
jgi:hypothetical protein